MRSYSWTAGLVILALVGCSQPEVHAKNPGPASLPSGWTLATDPESGVSVGVVSGWKEGVDTTMSLTDMAGNSPDSTQNSPDSSQGSAMDAQMESLKSQINAQSEQQAKEALAKLREKGIFLHIIDGSKPIPGEERTRYYVKKVDHNGNWSLKMACDDEVEYFKGWGADKPKLVNLPIGPVYKIAADYKTRGGDEVERIGYITVDGPATYLLRFISTNNPQAVLSIADDVAKTWRIVSPSHSGKS